MSDEDGDLDFEDWESSDDKFALRVTGDSMIDEHIQIGDYVVLRKAKDFESGAIVAFRDDDGEAALARFFKEGQRFRLEFANPALKPSYREKVEILGVLVGVVRKY